MLPHRALLALVLPIFALAAEQDWAQPQDHPVNALFKSDGPLPTVGSPEWKAKYPAAGVNGPTTPEKSDSRWIDALNAAKKAGKIPNVQQTKFDSGKGFYTYPDGVNPGAPEVCTLYSACRLTDGTIKNGPDGTMGLNFDDGPTPATSGLIGFLKQNNVVGTHFVIGNNVLVYPQQFQEIVGYGGDIAVHTWSHPDAMTSLTDEQIVAELGWAMQIIYDSTGGKAPKFWRPPGGDADLRVRAIAKEVFGMTTVFWNQDTFDWKIGGTEPGHTPETIAKDFDGWSTGPKSPGLIILEHEKSDVTVKVFTDNFPKMKSNGWNINSAAPLIKDGDNSSGGGGGAASPPSSGAGNPTSGNTTPGSTSAGGSQTPPTKAGNPTNSNVKSTPNPTSSGSSSGTPAADKTGNKNSSSPIHFFPWSWRIACVTPLLLFWL